MEREGEEGPLRGISFLKARQRRWEGKWGRLSPPMFLCPTFWSLEGCFQTYPFNK